MRADFGSPRSIRKLSLIRQIAGVLLLICLSSGFAAHATNVGSEVSITPSSDANNQAEVAIAVNPGNNRNLLAGYMTMAGTQFQLEHAGSSDSGTTWQNNARFALTGFNKFVDPTVGFNSGGTPYFVGLAEASATCITDDKSNCNASLIISKSSDGGTTWTAPNNFRPATCSNGSGFYNDKPDIKVDTSSSSHTIGKIFVSWTRIDGCPMVGSSLPGTSAVLARLTDTGSGFTEDFETRVGGATGGGTNTQVVWTDVAVDSNGVVYVAWVQLTGAPPSIVNEQISVAKSTDGGQTFTLSSITGGIVGAVIDALHKPSFELEPDPVFSNNVFLVYEDSSVNSGDIKFERSTDGGSTWANLVTVNSSTNGIQSFPAMSVVAGRIDIIWYDSRNFPQLNDHFDVFYSQSLDGGQTFSTDIKINSASLTNGGSTLGDYIGIASSTSAVYTAWIGGLPSATDVRDPIFTLLSSPGTGGGSGGSIAAGTLVTMADGTKEPVQDLVVGDKLLMYDVYRHTSVTATIVSIPTTIVNDKLTIFTDGGMPLRVDANPRLKFYVLTTNGPVLKPVTDFQTGDLIYNYDLAKWVPVTHIETSFGGNHLYYDLLTSPYLTSDGHFMNFIANGYADPCNPICKEGPTP